MKVEIIDDTKIKLIAESDKEKDLLDDWFMNSGIKFTSCDTHKGIINSIECEIAE